MSPREPEIDMEMVRKKIRELSEKTGAKEPLPQASDELGPPDRKYDYRNRRLAHRKGKRRPLEGLA